MALIDLFNQVCQRRVSVEADSEQGDLFGAFGKIPNRVTVKKGSKKRTVDLTISEARKWLADHDTRLVKNDNKDFAEMVAECEVHAKSGEESIGSILARMGTSQQSEAEDEISESLLHFELAE